MAVIKEYDQNGATLRLSLNELSALGEALMIARTAYDFASQQAGDCRLGAYHQDQKDTIDAIRQVAQDAHGRIWNG